MGLTTLAILYPALSATNPDISSYERGFSALVRRREHLLLCSSLTLANVHSCRTHVKPPPRSEECSLNSTIGINLAAAPHVLRAEHGIS